MLCWFPNKFYLMVQILVIFCGPFELNKAKATGIILNILNKESLHRIILVLENKINHFARTVFDECQVKVEMFPVRKDSFTHIIHRYVY